MRLTELQVRNVRCLSEVRIQPAPGINFITGENGSGKTSLLESIYLLTRARSFRPTPNQRLIRDGQAQLNVFARIQPQESQEFSLGMQRQAEQLRFKHSRHENARLVDMVRALPIQVISPDLHNLLERGPAQRRRFLDWGVFHVEQQFFSVWSQYQRALKQRNASLRRRQSESQIRAWDEALCATAESIDHMRHTHVAALKTAIKQSSNLQAIDADALEYHRGWSIGASLPELLRENIQRDRVRGFTSHGPHRADLRLRWEGRQARDIASRGEQKYLIATLLLLQAQYVGTRLKQSPVLLVDDLAAELGAGYRESLLQQVVDTGMQAFVSVLEPQQIPEALRSAEMFHVKHGNVTRAT